MDFCTLGMFIIDDIYPPPDFPSQTPQLDIIGGAGTYSAIGARIFSPSPISRSVGWILDAGTDFPPELQSEIQSWDTSVLIRNRPAPTTRGWNGYGANQRRAFKYLTEKKRLTAEDLTPKLLAARSFHLICSPSRCIEQVESILSRRRQDLTLDFHAQRPCFIWEPVPDLCTPEELENTLAALKSVDIVSPNHEELAGLFGFSHTNGVNEVAVEEHAQRLLQSGIGHDGKGAVVVRAGARGCFVLNSSEREWLPAYHQDSKKVVDPTGGGNGFLGGFAVGLVRSNFSVYTAAAFGSVAASFCIEQFGTPHLNPDNESCNGIDVGMRLREFCLMMPQDQQIAAAAAQF